MQKTINDFEVMNLDEATKYVVNKILSARSGGRFTSQSLFADIQLHADKRSRGIIMRRLQSMKLIDKEGWTTQDQESRNNGVASLWRVV